MLKRSVFPVIVLTGFLLCIHIPLSSADRDVEEIEEQDFKMEPGGTVKIAVDEGYVRITTWDRSEVSVKMMKHARGKNKREAQRRLEEIDINIEHRRDRLTIRERDLEDRSYSIFDLLDPDTWNEMSGRITWVDFELRVPAKTNLIINTDEGDIIVSHAEGDVDVDTDEGEVELRHIRSDRLSVITDEGDILLERIEPQDSYSSSRIEIDTDEGQTELVDVETGRLKIESDEGDVVTDMLRCERLDFYSDEGTIDAELDVQSGGDYRCRTDEGEIILSLSADASFDLTARTQEGEIRSDFSLEVREVGDGERVDDTVRGGGADMYLFTEEGDIRLRKK